MLDTRSQGTPLQPLVPEIDRHYHQLRRDNLSAIRMSDDRATNGVNEEASTRRELVPEITYGTYMQPGEIRAGGSAIVLSVAARNMEIKSHHFHDMPKYYGMDNEDVIRFLKEFEALIARLPLTVGNVTITDEEIRKKVFPMCMQDKAKRWLLNQPEGSLATWDDLYKSFMSKFYPAEKTRQLRVQIEKFMQLSDESFYEAGSDS